MGLDALVEPFCLGFCLVEGVGGGGVAVDCDSLAVVGDGVVGRLAAGFCFDGEDAFGSDNDVVDVALACLDVVVDFVAGGAEFVEEFGGDAFAVAAEFVSRELTAGGVDPAPCDCGHCDCGKGGDDGLAADGDEVEDPFVEGVEGGEDGEHEPWDGAFVGDVADLFVEGLAGLAQGGLFQGRFLAGLCLCHRIDSSSGGYFAILVVGDSIWLVAGVGGALWD